MDRQPGICRPERSQYIQSIKWLNVKTYFNKNAKALKYIQSFINQYLCISIVFLAEICLKYTKFFYILPWKIKFDHSCCFLSTHTPLSVLVAILDFEEIGYFMDTCDINFPLYEYFRAKEVKCNVIQLFVSIFHHSQYSRSIWLFLFHNFSTEGWSPNL